MGQRTQRSLPFYFWAVTSVPLSLRSQDLCALRSAIIEGLGSFHVDYGRWP